MFLSESEAFNLDKRLWKIEKPINKIDAEIIKNTPLCTIQMVIHKYSLIDSPPVTIIEDIFSLKDLQGVYLGG